MAYKWLSARLTTGKNPIWVFDCHTCKMDGMRMDIAIRHVTQVHKTGEREATRLVTRLMREAGPSYGMRWSSERSCWVPAREDVAA
jgi:hypothetical protein